MYLCYIDESGTSDIPGNTSHFVLAGLAIPIEYWRKCDNDIANIKEKHKLPNKEIHTAWLLRPYIEQRKIDNFDSLDYRQRRSEVESRRKAELLRLQKSSNRKHYNQTKKNYRKTEAYIHLTYTERYNFIMDIAQCISNWGFARLFAECIDKIHFDPSRTQKSIDEQAFEQVVSRFEQFLQITEKSNPDLTLYGLLIHDNNETIAKRHTELMKNFYKKGTPWTGIKKIIETPLFVNSQLTSMVQIADLCAYALRRYLEKDENQLFELVFKRADRKSGTAVGVRHFTKTGCSCAICNEHKTTGPLPELPFD